MPGGTITEFRSGVAGESAASGPDGVEGQEQRHRDADGAGQAAASHAGPSRTSSASTPAELAAMAGRYANR